MSTDVVVRNLEAEIAALRKALELYTSCRHGEQYCNCTLEARAALYPYLKKASADAH